MKRRNFIKGLAKAGAVAPFMLNGLPMQAFSKKGMFKQMEWGGVNDDRKLVLIQLHGGNDGLNMLIPIPQYAQYFSLRSNIAIPDSGARAYIPLDSTLPAGQQVGLHPDMTSLKELYDDGKVSIIQSVGYENVNKSHFRGRDIWFMGGDYDEYKNSGWMGRYLDNEYPNYPDQYPSIDMPDPLGLEIGTAVSLGFHRANGIPVALANNDPANFNDLISNIGGGTPMNIPANNYGEELQNIIDLYQNANDYAAQLEVRYNAGFNNVVYPTTGLMEYPGPTAQEVVVNPLGWQLQTVARLINGGCKTRIYLVRLNGFDTHNAQAIQNDTTHGYHAALLYHLSTAVKAFMDDLAISGKDEEVLACTFSEFGRRPYSNASLGTDHGTAAPMIVIGKGVEPGVIGNVDLNDLDNTGNLNVQTDYREVFGAILCDWMGADADDLDVVEFNDFVTPALPLINSDYSLGEHEYISNDDIAGDAVVNVNIYPNPARSILRYKVQSTKGLNSDVTVLNPLGQVIYQDNLQILKGNNSFSLGIGRLSSGTYTLHLCDSSNGERVAVEQFVKVN